MDILTVFNESGHVDYYCSMLVDYRNIDFIMDHYINNG
jgi:hypothetical protein